MVTHFAELTLQTVSLIGVKQIYEDCLDFRIIEETEDVVRFAVTPHTTLRFVEKQEPLCPAHIAFEVKHSTFDRSAGIIREMGLPVCGDIIQEHSNRRYFRDGDGNILEIFSHDYINENIVPATQPLDILYLREIGFVVEELTTFHNWMCDTFDMSQCAGSSEGEFSMLVGGTAHPVLNHISRDWIPIAMKALKPKMEVVLGAPSDDFVSRVARFPSNQEEYRIVLRHTPEFKSDIPAKLGLPNSQSKTS